MPEKNLEPGAGPQHKRRTHYKGLYPKKYQEKYKELQPDKYAGTLEHVTDKGSTPAGTHIPIMVKEILAILQIKPGEVGFDATLGYGGHTLEMLKQLDRQGHLYATDVDPIEAAKTKERLAKLGYDEQILTIGIMNYAGIDRIAAEAGGFNFLLADLGVSSMQLDNPERGFSYKNDGPLDLRMNPRKGVSAAQRLQQLEEEELEGLLIENADEPYAKQIARMVGETLRKGHPLATTRQLQRVIERALQQVPAAERKEAVKKACARTFQALRIDVNHEFETLYTFLEKLPYAMAPGGRIAILTFHSGEDRLVKKSFKELHRLGVYADIAEEVIRPSAEECVRNRRAKPTKLRWAIRSREQL